MKKIVTSFFVVTIMCILFASTASAHELRVEAEHLRDIGEFRVDVHWGHIRDFNDPVDIEALSLHMRTPDGAVEELPLEAVGVHARAYVVPQQSGDYVFWAVRTPGIYVPEGQAPALSAQSAKTVLMYGEGPSTMIEATDLIFEIAPSRSNAAFETGTFEGVVLLNNEPVSDAVVTAYGPDGLHWEGTTASQGTFELELEAAGKWLIKANISIDETGEIEAGSYETISRTSTLLVDSVQAEADSAETNGIMMFVIFLIGLFLGAAAAFVISSMRAKK